MVITILAEPRSGSTNFANWFVRNLDFTVLFEPMTNPGQVWYKGNTPPEEWTYSTEHLLVKEILGNGPYIANLLGISDRVILLYRENEQEQLDSWLNATVKDTWDKQWIYTGVKSEEEERTFREFKERFKAEYLSGDYFKVSYEELYYRDGFQKVLEYINIPGLENTGFPYGIKYRVDLKTKTLI